MVNKLIILITILILFIGISICSAGEIHTKYTIITGVEYNKQIAETISLRVDRCIDDIQVYLGISIPEKHIMRINIFPNSNFIKTLCGGKDGIQACTWLPKNYSYPTIQLCTTTYKNNILTHELIHAVLWYMSQDFTMDIHEEMAYGLEDKLCNW